MHRLIPIVISSSFLALTACGAMAPIPDSGVQDASPASDDASDGIYPMPDASDASDGHVDDPDACAWVCQPDGQWYAPCYDAEVIGLKCKP